MSTQTFTLPDVGEGLTEADVLSWHVAVGDEVGINQVVAEVETAKAAVELPSPFQGVVAELHAREGQTVAVGAPILSVTSSGSPATDVLVGYGTRESSSGRRRRRRAAADSPTTRPVGRRPPATPPVRKMAKDLGVDLTAVAYEGDHIRRDDIRRHLADPDGTPENTTGSTTPERRVPITGVRRATAAAMTRSAFTAPHATEFVTVDVTATMDVVATLKAHPALAEVRVTPLVLVARALLSAIRRHPDINARWDDETQEIVHPASVNLGIAAATARGLIVPNIKDAQTLGLVELARSLDDLTTTARAGRTTPDQMSRGTITITNIGALGVDAATPILNPGEAAILCVGAIRRRPWEYRGEIALRHVAELSLAFDHRLVDGELGARVLTRVADVLADPATELLLE